jgi:hypothetical protein
MRRSLPAAAALCLLSTPLYAQTAVGTGVGISDSTSVSGAVAVNRGNGNSRSNSSNALTINNPAIPTTTTQNVNQSGTTTQNQNISGTTNQNINQSGTVTSRIQQSGDTTTRVVSSGTSTVRTVPSMVAPGLAAAGLETCLGSASGTVSAVGFGIGGGSTYTDEGCQARLDSRTLYAYGLKEAAVARLCQRAEVWRSMPAICERYWPPGVPYPYGITVAAPQVVMAASGATRVIDGRDGVEKDCLNYSYGKQKCYQWAGQAPHKRQHVANVQAPQRIIVKPKPKPVEPKAEPEPAKAEPPKS